MITHVGQRVQLRYCPEHKGTVVTLSPAGFTVQYDWPVSRPARKRGERRERYSYPVQSSASFVPESHEEIRPVEDVDIDLRIDIPESILKAYGAQLKDG